MEVDEEGQVEVVPVVVGVDDGEVGEEGLCW